MNELRSSDVHKNIEYDWGEHYGYETFEFFPSNKFTLSEFDLNGVRQSFLLMGEYIQNGSEIKYTYERTPILRIITRMVNLPSP